MVPHLCACQVSGSHQTWIVLARVPASWWMLVYQWGRTILHLRFFSFACWHFGWSMVRAQMCVVILVRLLDSIPPMARVAPIIASLSPLGISAHVRLTWLKKSIGSGVYGRIEACLFLNRDAVIHEGVTTAIMSSRAVEYSRKSLVVDIICVRLFISLMPLGPSSCTSPA